MKHDSGIFGKPVEAEKLRNLPQYMFARIGALMLKLRQEGNDVIDFGMGNPDRPTPTHIVDKLCEAIKDPRTHRYSASKGIPALRRAITYWYAKRYGVELDPDREAVAVIGSKEGLSHLALALLDPGDAVMVPSPTYPSHMYSVILSGGQIIDYPLVEPEAILTELSSIVSHMYPKPKALILSFPHNPTTYVVRDIRFFEEIVDFARSQEIMVIHDSAYAEICFDGYRAPSFLEAKGAKNIGIEFYSLSKTYNMAGWRCGFAVGNPKIIGALAKLKSYYDYGIFTPIQVAAIKALRGPQDCVTELVNTYQSRRDTLVESLSRIGWDVPKPLATMYIWAPIPEQFAGMGSMEFSEMLLTEADVAVTPGIGYGKNGEGYVRFALIENELRIKQAARNIRRLFRNKGNS